MGIIFLAIAIFRLTLVDRGLMYWWDDRMHWFSMRMWSDVASGDWADFLKTPFHPKIQGRPLWILLNMVPAGLQVIWFLIRGLKTETPASLHIVGIYNVFLSMVVVILFWLIAKKLLRSRMSALVATIVYAFLANSTINVRHMYPIYSSLILYISSLLILLRPGAFTWKQVILSGIIAGLGQLTYASYFLFPIFNLVVLAYRHIRLRIIGGFCLGYMAPILIFELWARAVRTSIYASISKDPGLNPSFAEALWFLPTYLIQAEGLMGIVLVILTGLLIGLSLTRIIKRQPLSLATVLGLAGLIAYIAFAVSSIWHHRIYARVIHIYILFLILGIAGVMEFVSKQKRYWLFLFWGIVSIYSVYSWGGDFINLNYPLDTKFKICGTYYRCPDTVMEVDENDTQLTRVIPDKTQFILVNTIYMFPKAQTANLFVPPNNFRLISDSIHPLNFIPYQLEGYNPQEINWLRQYRYTVRVYQKIGQ